MNDNSPFRCPECGRLSKECVCDDERFEEDYDPEEDNACPYCEGDGCEECDGTGLYNH
jgi:hypothetical protein